MLDPMTGFGLGGSGFSASQPLGIFPTTVGLGNGSGSPDTANSGATADSGTDAYDAAFMQQLYLDMLEAQINSGEAEKQREFEREMSNTAYQRAVADLKAAGLNPWLALQGSGLGGASTPSGAAASVSTGNQSYSSIYGTDKRTSAQMAIAVMNNATKLVTSVIGLFK